jgi:hypothetical protein
MASRVSHRPVHTPGDHTGEPQSTGPRHQRRASESCTPRSSGACPGPRQGLAPRPRTRVTSVAARLAPGRGHQLSSAAPPAAPPALPKVWWSGAAAAADEAPITLTPLGPNVRRAKSSAKASRAGSGEGMGPRLLPPPLESNPATPETPRAPACWQAGAPAVVLIGWLLGVCVAATPRGRCTTSAAAAWPTVRPKLSSLAPTCEPGMEQQPPPRHREQAGSGHSASHPQVVGTHLDVDRQRAKQSALLEGQRGVAAAAAAAASY